ncbi:MAG: ATP-binding protein [Xenococcaceae cyanobacterium MO_167.B27]|nr:ATP-binding protein [Xenococcaceae cyanobacterium MO_167.B27]
MNNNNTKQKFHLQVKTKLEALQEVLQWYEELISPRLPEQTGRQCEVALVEAFTNAVRHAHQDLPSNTPIDLEVELYPNCLEMRVWDQGKPFDLQAQLQANQDNVTSLDKEGGRGLQFIKKLTDDLQYLSNLDYRNCLIIKKRYSQTSNIA